MKIGTPVIINGFDRPCTRLVAIVTKIKNNVVYAKYLTKDVLSKKCSAYISKVTPISDFGVELRIEDGIAFCQIVGENKATYCDGNHRPWQAEFVEEHVVRPEVLLLLENTETN